MIVLSGRMHSWEAKNSKLKHPQQKKKKTKLSESNSDMKNDRKTHYSGIEELQSDSMNLRLLHIKLLMFRQTRIQEKDINEES
jgi:hypothetical protein